MKNVKYLCDISRDVIEPESYKCSVDIRNVGKGVRGVVDTLHISRTELTPQLDTAMQIARSNRNRISIHTVNNEHITHVRLGSEEFVAQQDLTTESEVLLNRLLDIADSE